MPNFLGTFVQPNLTVTNVNPNITSTTAAAATIINNNNNNNSNINNNNNKSTIKVLKIPTGYHKVQLDDDKSDIPMVVDDVKLQQQTTVNMPTQQQQQQLVEGLIKTEDRHQDTLENNNLRIKEEDVKPSTPSSSPYIDINSLPMVFDDTKLFLNVSEDYIIVL